MNGLVVKNTKNNTVRTPPSPARAPAPTGPPRARRPELRPPSFMRPNQELIAVKYFSARPDDIEQSRRQNAFFQANKKNPKFRLILGKYLKKEITCFKYRNPFKGWELLKK